MIRRPPISTRTDTLLPYTTLCRSQLAEHGGGAVIRDISLLQSALSRPRNLAAYDNPDPAALAASYAFGIARNHPFVDGNKRTALVVAETFINLNGWETNADNA